MSTELVIVQENLSIFDKITMAPDARIEYENGSFQAIYPKDAETIDYVFSKYTFADSSVEVSENSVIVGTENNSLLALVPEENYQ
jgi:hypothetical protein